MVKKCKCSRIRRIIDRANKEFKPAKFKYTKKAVYYLGETKQQYHKRLQHNFFVYATALWKIAEEVEKENER